MGSHTGCAQDDAVPVGAGRLRKGGGSLRRAVGGKNVGLIRHAEFLQYRAGGLDYRPIAVRAHDDRNFFHAVSNLPYKAKQRSGLSGYTALRS